MVVVSSWEAGCGVTSCLACLPFGAEARCVKLVVLFEDLRCGWGLVLGGDVCEGNCWFWWWDFSL